MHSANEEGNFLCFICLIPHLLSLMVNSEDTKKDRNTDHTRMRWQTESPGIWHGSCSHQCHLYPAVSFSGSMLEPHLQLWHYTWKTDVSPPHPNFNSAAIKCQIHSLSCTEIPGCRFVLLWCHWSLSQAGPSGQTCRTSHTSSRSARL